MPRRPRHPKPDGNQRWMVEELRQCGLVVLDISSLGGECLDLMVGDPTQNRWLQVEVKTDAGTLTTGEARYIERFGAFLPIVVARSARDVLIAIERTT